VLTINQESITTLEGMEWRSFSGVGQAVFSLLGAKPEGKKENHPQRQQRRRKM
jgi:hypothetical protein